jgi:hypothetical protein
MSHTMNLWKRVIKHHLKKLTTSLKSVWFYVWEIHHGGDFLDKITYEKISRTEWPTYNIY